jgi:hypothetical protein
MSDANDEAKFTAKVIAGIDPALTYGFFYMEARGDRWSDDVTVPPGSGAVVDAEGDVVAVCPTLAHAEVVCKLLAWALENYPFHNPDDPSIVTKGLTGPVVSPAEDGPDEESHP